MELIFIKKLNMKLDHVVYFTHSTPEETVIAQKKSGRHAVVGGRHEQWGTRNALLYARNAYVEWLSVEKSDIAQNADHPLTTLLLHDLTEGDGWGTLCISVENIEEFNREIQQKNFITSDVIAAERKTPHGGVRKWKMLFINQSVSDQLPFPFFIEWAEAEDLRFDTLRKEGIILPSNEALDIKECVFHVNDPLKERSAWARLLSQEISDSNEIVLPNVRLRFMAREGNGSERLVEVVVEGLGGDSFL